jgi:glutamine cyclotransferase
VSTKRTRRRFRWILAALAAAAVVAFVQTRTGQAPGSTLAETLRYDVVRAYPHDPGAFTQGLVYRDGFLFESTGRNGSSSLRKVQLETGKVLQRHDLDARYFAEGLTDWSDRLIQLTWQTNVGFVYDLASFRVLNTFTYQGEGWGLTRDSRRLIMSDGTPTLRFLDPATLKEAGSVVVRDGTEPVDNLNELEFINEQVFANVWLTDLLAIIEPASGKVTGWVDLRGLLPEADRRGADVLNGIAYDAQGDRLFVTGKLWPKLFEIRVRR